MSACSDFAEHVWKPGSCKNCFHPLSAHRRTVGSAGGSEPTACSKSGPGGDEEAGLTAPLPYSKPTIAVKPTMMSLDTNESVADVNMNIEQENTKSPADHLGLKLLNLSSLYIDGNGCNKIGGPQEAVLKSPETKTDYNNCFSLTSLSPNIQPKDSMVISNIFVTQEEGRGSHSLKKNATGMQRDTRTKIICNGPSVTARLNGQGSVGKPFPVGVVPSSPARVHSNSRSSGSSPDVTTKTPNTLSNSASSPDTSNHNPPTSLNSPPLSKQTSLSDSSCSFRSSTDSLPGEEGLGQTQVGSRSLQSPTALLSSQSIPNSPSGRPDVEPIYAESTKKKRPPQGHGVQSKPEPLNPPKTSPQCSEHQHSGDGQWTTITVMAAHTEADNKTFYLSSPDSSISTQSHFSPTGRKDPSSPAFRWPAPNTPSLVSEASLTPPLHPKPQSSPPVPPKRTNRSPKLGTSSLLPCMSSPVPLPNLPKLDTPTLSPSISSPVPLPDLPKLGTPTLSPSVSSPIPLPDLPKLGTLTLSPSVSSPVPLPEPPMLFLVSAKEGHFKVHTDNHTAVSERWHKPPHHSPGWNCRIEEEEEDEERERKEGEKKKKLPHSTGTTYSLTSLVNGASVWKESRDVKAHRSPPPMTEPGTTPPAPHNNGACQGESKDSGGQEEGQHNGSMPARQRLHGRSSEPLAAGKGSATNEPNPPPPPPKKLHRVCGGKMSGSSLELDQQGPVESPPPSLRGLGSNSLSMTSSDYPISDRGSRDATQMSCSSPCARSPVASAPGSPLPPSSSFLTNQPPPLPEKKMVNRTASAPDSSNGKPFIQAYPRLMFTGSESNVCQPANVGSRSSLPSSPVDPRPMFSSNESLERCQGLIGRTSRSRTLDEPLKTQGRLGVHCRGSVTCSSSPQLSVPITTAEPGLAPNLGSSLQLQTLLSNIDSREGVYSKLGGLYAESLRRLALKCEDHFTRSQKNPLRFEESNWSLFRLTSNKPSCMAGDAVYYSAACASDPSHSYAVKICKSPSMEAKQGHLYGLSVQQSIPPHFNLQQDCGHFLACVPQSMLPSDEASPSVPGPPVDRERVVVITSEIPQQTAADFVQEWEAFHKSQPEVYERRVCFLLLQLCNGLEHLKEHGVTHRDLCLENLLLVPHYRRSSQFPQQHITADSNSNGVDTQRHLPRLLISNFAKAKRRSCEDAASTTVDPRIKRDHARLAPEIVSAAQYRKFDEFQTGILIYELLHQPNPFELSPALKEQDYRCEDLPPIPSVSLYSAGLHRLAQLLLQPDPIKRIHIQEAKRILQSLLWGPRKDLMEQQAQRYGGFVGGPRHEGLLNWLDVKRALLMMKFAERSLEPERNAELEDWLCCQYFSSAHPMSLCHTAELLYALK
ncbi:inactive tyrosine-protein kinase PRAG1-like [Antennarius striatus]|uniref:inactive tyrosine-protein kinase PRAG1-like n=1 Tax=Antennarius striatus TaxID=241820 RepID=UPI0035AF0EE4